MKRFISLIIFVITFSCCVSSSMANIIDMSNIIEENGLKLGDYIVLGHYNGEPIVWRYVLDDENGKLMFSDKILCNKAYDSIEKIYQIPTDGVWRSEIIEHLITRINDSTGEPFTEEEVGSHVRARERMGQIMGCNYWGDSNIRSWLNSSADAGEVKWLCGLAPEDENFRSESGFLSDDNFLEAERSLIKPVVLGTALDDADSKQANFTDENGNLIELLPERVFLLDAEQVRGIAANSNVLGVYIVQTLKREERDDIWLRQPETSLVMAGKQPYYGSHVLYTSLDYEKENIIFGSTLSIFSQGIRPAFYLNEDGLYIVSGSGTEMDPYMLAASPSYEVGHVDVEFPGFDITINGIKYSKDNECPVIAYNNITYLPMTQELKNFIGVEIKEDPWFKTLEIDKYEIRKESFEQHLGTPATVLNAEIADGFLISDNIPVDNRTQAYPILRFQNILYLPVTWNVAHDTLGWEYSFDENGLVVNTGN